MPIVDPFDTQKGIVDPFDTPQGKRYSIEDDPNWPSIPEDPNTRVQTTDTQTGKTVTGTKAFNQFVPPETPLSAAPQRPKPTIPQQILRGVELFGGGANRSIAGLAGLPVDAITGGINTFMGGMNALTGAGTQPPHIQNPVGGSQWIQDKLLPNQPRKPANFVENLLYSAGEMTPTLMAPGGAMTRGPQAIKAAKASIPSLMGSAGGMAMARTLAPDNWKAEMAGAILGGVAGGIPSTAALRTPNVDNLIKRNLNTAIRPTVAGKNVASDISKYEDKGIGVVKQIVQDARESKVPVPQTLEEFASSIENLRGKVFKKFDALAQQAGEQGATVRLKPIISELDEVITNPVVKDLAPDVVAFANEQKQTFINRGNYSTQQAQEAIAILNAQLKAYYEGRATGISEMKAKAMAGVATKLRNALDDTIERYGGDNYQELKNQYGQLKALEKDVVKRTVVDKRKNPHGFFDLSDMFSASKLVTGLLRAEPSTAAAGGAMLAVKRFLKMGNDPNKIIQKMFHNVDKYMPEEPVFAGPAKRDLGFTTGPYEPDMVINPRGMTPRGPLRNQTPPVIDGEYRSVTPLGGGQRAGLLDSPRNTGPINMPWNPVNRPGRTADRLSTIQQPPVANIDLKAMAKKLYDMGFPPSEIQDMIQQEIVRRRGPR
jgi:hypothetical protein